MFDFFLYEAEKEAIKTFLKAHSHEQPNNIAPERYTISFHRNSVTTIPTIRCWCGVSENLACNERYDNI